MLQYLHRLRSEFFPAQDAFDLSHGTDTSGTVSLHRLRIGSLHKAEGHHYKPCGEELFRDAMAEVPRNLPFIDLGCGKGRTLIMARELGFTNVTGVEFSESLAEAARLNSPDTPVLTMDAADYEFPKEPVCLFLYNPFGPAVLGPVMKRAPSGSLMVYVVPLHWPEVATLRCHQLVRTGEAFRVFLLH